MPRTPNDRSLLIRTLIPLLLASIMGRADHLWAADLSIKPGDQVIRIDVRTRVQLQQILGMDLDIHSHEIGVGPLDVHVSTAERQAIEAAHLAYTVLNPDLLAAYQHELITHTRRDITDFQDYKTFDNIVAFINNLAMLRPDLCEVVSIGTSLEGRDIWVLHVTGSGAGPKPAVFYHGLQHAREWITGPMVLYLAEYLVTNYDTDACLADLIDRTDFFLAPCVNPDGYVYTWTTDRLWRKNRRPNADGTFGVDLNRNWGFDWGGAGSSGSPSSQTYRGTGPFSEPETTVLSDFIVANPNIRAYMDYHNYSQLILWPFGSSFTQPPGFDGTTFWSLGNAMQSLISGVHGMFYEPGPIALTLYQASGNSVDWVYGDQGRFSFTIELRDTGQFGFLLPPEQIIPTVEENLPAILHLSHWASDGVVIDLPNGVPNVVMADQTTNLTVSITNAQESYVSGSGTMHYRFDPADPFTTVPFVSQGSNLYTATLPAAACGLSFEYYFSASGDGGFSATYPCDAPNTLLSTLVRVFETAFADDFELDTGWTVQNAGATSGDWERGVPINDPGWAYDPASDSDGSGNCFLTQNTLGNSDVDNGATRLLSPIIDMTGDGGLIGYDYYLNLTNESGTDILLVEANNSAGLGMWSEVARHTANGGSLWRHHEIDSVALLAAGVPLTDMMRLRFTINDGTPQTIVEAGLDAFTISLLTCPTVACPNAPGDMNGDLVMNGDDVQMFADAMTNGSGYDPCADVAAPSGSLDEADLQAFVNMLLAP